MSRKSAHAVSGGVWPGYVAAVAGLVQSLLFVSSVVATVVYLLGILGGQQTPPLVSARPVEAQASHAPAQPPRTATEPRRAASVGHSWPGAFKPMVLVFPVRQVELDGQSQQRLLELVQRWQRDGAVQWRLMAHHQPHDDVGLRRSYFRLQLLRNQLIDRGVDPRAIEMKVLPVSGPLQGEHEVWVMASPQPPAKVGGSHE